MKKQVLYINSNIRAGSRTAVIADAFLNALDSSRFEITELRIADLGLKPLTGDFFEERQALLEAGKLDHRRFDYARQFAAADLIVISAPFWDLSFPAVLKIYIENIALESVTFRSEGSGLIGICRAEKMFYFTSRGGIVPTGSEMDQGTAYLKAIASFFGIREFACAAANGMDLPDYDRCRSLADAVHEAERMAAELNKNKI
ncbi:MAG: NAD(P)H-dependent oxidoreductase [Solobacterium sp.]|nr:NAD(P)H-dependent oxidoreductase [Solobacterium sp.]